jgi:tetratricopeptide (TPR) repeat protein
MPDTGLVEPTYTNLNEGLAAARVAREQQGLEAALHLLTRLREQYQDSLAATYQAHAMLLEAGRPDDADSWLGEARSRFPHDIGLAAQHARLAQRRHDVDEAVCRWQAVCDEFPDDPTGSTGLVATLREAARFDVAESVAVNALDRFPEAPALLIEHAFVAHMRQDWSTAAGRWEVARSRQPEHHIGYVLGAQCLRTSGQVDAAEALLHVAIERFPDLAAPLVELAWTAHVRLDWPAAVERWETVGARFPDQVARYTGGSQALQRLGRLDEAEALLAAAVAMFPNELGPLHEYAGLAQYRRDWPEAVRRWERMREMHPEDPRGYQGGVSALRAAGQQEDAEELLTAAVARLPGHMAKLVEYASTVQVRLDWGMVARRCEEMRQAAPDNLQGYTAGARALQESQQSAAADALLEDAMQRFPNSLEPFLEYAGVATRRGDWDVALRRLIDARRRFPGDARIVKAMHEAQLRAGPEGAELAEESHTAGSPDAADANSEMREIVSAFTSLGGEPRGCEFGEVQRFYGAEPLDLLRWTESLPAGLTAALETRFEGIGDPEQTEVFPHQLGERWFYEVRDRRFGMTAHTYIAQDEAPQEKVAAQTCRRMQYLRRKLIDDLEAANKVFVYRTAMRNLSDAEIGRLHAAVRGYSNDATLLYLRYTDDAHPDGTVQVARPGLLIGYLDRFGATASYQLVEIPIASWTTVCREAYRLWQSGATREEREPIEQAATITDAEPADATPDDAVSYMVEDEPAEIPEQYEPAEIPEQYEPAETHEQYEPAPIPEPVASAPIDETPRTGWRQVIGSIFRRRI